MKLLSADAVFFSYIKYKLHAARSKHMDAHRYIYSLSRSFNK